MGLEKAILWELTADKKPTRVEGKGVHVQFNPTSLKLQLTSAADSGKSTQRQAQQFTSTTPRTLTFELIFDTADEGETGAAVDVREYTAAVEKFVLASGDKAPPKVGFQWGAFVFNGVMTSCGEDFDLFSPEGVPLRAKLNVSITEQDPDFEASEKGAGAREAKATPPGQSAAGQPGSSGTKTTDSTGIAIGGETAADFAVRMGLDASAWRGLSVGLDASLSLSAGLEIDFSAGLSLGAGLGITVGAEASAGVSLEASFGLAASASVTAGAAASFGASGQAAAGMALSAAGGVKAAVETVKIMQAEAQAQAARAAFQAPPAPRGSPGVPASAAATGAPTLGPAALPPAVAAAAQAAASPGAVRSVPQPARPDQPRTPLAPSSAASPAQSPLLTARIPKPPAPRPPASDPRSTSFGRGVPLRPRVTGAANERGGPAMIAPRERAPEAPVTRDPTVAPWAALPAVTPGRAAADRHQGTKRPARPCGCARPCNHGGARP